jgi:N-acyl-D-aspartate/D-glutamate deacylase
MRKLSAETGRPISFGLSQHNHAPEAWREVLRLTEEAIADGADLRPQVSGRPLNLLIGWQTFHPFATRETYLKIADLPLAERVAQLRKPEIRDAIINEPSADTAALKVIGTALDRIFPMGEPPNYEPAASESVSAIAARLNRPDEEVLYDLMMAHDGRELLMFALLGFSYGNLDAVREMLVHPSTALGLSDGGAHVGAVCDASMPTFMLTHWARDRAYDRLPLELVVRKTSLDTARLYGLGDRGVIKPGFKADLNVLDFDALALQLPHVAYDLPGGARRLVQGATGYVATIVSGEVTLTAGHDTGARPGRLVRGAR